MQPTRRTAALMGVVMALSMLMALPALGDTVGDEAACTPGYWKNHTDNWLEEVGDPISPDKPVGEAFASASYPDDTFLEALSYRGGPGAAGAERILLHHAVAAWLNAAYDDDLGNLQYPLRRVDFVPDVNAAIDSGDRATMLALAAELDAIANSLPCPLN